MKSQLVNLQALPHLAKATSYSPTKAAINLHFRGDAEALQPFLDVEDALEKLDIVALKSKRGSAPLALFVQDCRERVANLAATFESGGFLGSSLGSELSEAAPKHGLWNCPKEKIVHIVGDYSALSEFYCLSADLTLVDSRLYGLESPISFWCNYSRTASLVAQSLEDLLQAQSDNALHQSVARADAAATAQSRSLQPRPQRVDLFLPKRQPPPRPRPSFLKSSNAQSHSAVTAKRLPPSDSSAAPTVRDQTVSHGSAPNRIDVQVPKQQPLPQLSAILAAVSNWKAIESYTGTGIHSHGYDVLAPLFKEVFGENMEQPSTVKQMRTMLRSVLKEAKIRNKTHTHASKNRKRKRDPAVQTQTVPDPAEASSGSDGEGDEIEGTTVVPHNIIRENLLDKAELQDRFRYSVDDLLEDDEILRDDPEDAEETGDHTDDDIESAALRTLRKKRRMQMHVAQAAEKMRLESRSENTSLAYKAPQEEFMAFALSNFGDDLVVDGVVDRMAAYLLKYLIPRGNIKVVGKRQNKRIIQTGPVSKFVMKRHCAAIVDLHIKQTAHLPPGAKSSHPRTKHAMSICKSIETRMAELTRANFKDRGIGGFQDGYGPAQHTQVALYWWGQRTYIPAALRNLTEHLVGHASFDRSNNRRMLELGDLSLVELGSSEGPTRPCIALIDQQNRSKLNKDGHLDVSVYMRHRDPMICAHFAFAAMMVWRYDIEKNKFPNFAKAEEWYQIPVFYGKRYDDHITYDAQLNAVTAAHKAVGITSNKKTHLNRGVGARHAIQNGARREDVERQGGWSQKNVADRHYLHDLPLETARVLANFSNKPGSFYLPRVIEPPVELRRLVFPELDEWLEFSQRSSHIALRAVVKRFDYMRDVFLQDAAILQQTHPDHPFFGCKQHPDGHPAFRDPAWKSFSMQVAEKHHAGLLYDPHKQSRIEETLPSVASALDAQRREFTLELQTLRQTVEALAQRDQQMPPLVNHLLTVNQTLSLVCSHLGISTGLPSTPLPQLQCAPQGQIQSSANVVNQFHTAVQQHWPLTTPHSATSATSAHAPTNAVIPSALNGCTGQAPEPMIVIPPFPVQTFQPTTSSLSAPRRNGKQKPVLPAEAHAYTMSRNLYTVAQVWEEYTRGILNADGVTRQPSIRYLEETYGHAWTTTVGKSFHSYRKLIYDEVKRLAASMPSRGRVSPYEQAVAALECRRGTMSLNVFQKTLREMKPKKAKEVAAA